jgi:tRNA G18 (ribose-2'-O)-methylase SpoU
VLVQRIESLEDPRVADYRDIKDVRLRDQAGIFLAEGRIGVRRLLRSDRFRTRSVFVTEPALRALEEDFARSETEIPVFVADPVVLNRVVGFDMHRGCLAAGLRDPLPTCSALVGSLATGRRLLAVLEDVGNPENVGSVFRNTLAFGGAAVLLSAGCADPLYRKAIRVSMGASLRVPYARFSDWPAAADALRAAGFHIVALSTDPSAHDIVAYAPNAAQAERVALLIGAEGDGLSPDAIACVDAAVRIPMIDCIDSLNVATATGIALHHFARLDESSANDHRKRGPDG